MATPVSNNTNLTHGILNNWSKSSEGLVECCVAASEVLDFVFTEWHRDLRNKPQCTNRGICSKKRCKPKKQTHCKSCVQWVDIICGGNGHAGIVVNADKVNWNNATSSEFSNGPLAVSKILGLKNIQQSDLANIKKFSDFDSAWTLQILQNIKSLSTHPDLVKEISNVNQIRNQLMHRGLVTRLRDDEIDKQFRQYISLVTALDTYCHSANIDTKDVQAKLDKIKKAESDEERIKIALDNFIKQANQLTVNTNNADHERKRIQVKLDSIIKYADSVNWPDIAVNAKKAIGFMQGIKDDVGIIKENQKEMKKDIREIKNIAEKVRKHQNIAQKQQKQAPTKKNDSSTQDLKQVWIDRIHIILNPSATRCVPKFKPFNELATELTKEHGRFDKSQLGKLQEFIKTCADFDTRVRNEKLEVQPNHSVWSKKWYHYEKMYRDNASDSLDSKLPALLLSTPDNDLKLIPSASVYLDEGVIGQQTFMQDIVSMWNTPLPGDSHIILGHGETKNESLMGLCDDERKDDAFYQAYFDDSQYTYKPEFRYFEKKEKGSGVYLGIFIVYSSEQKQPSLCKDGNVWRCTDRENTLYSNIVDMPNSKGWFELKTGKIKPVKTDNKKESLELERLKQLKDDNKSEPLESEKLKQLKTDNKKESLESDKLNQLEDDNKNEPLESEKLKQLKDDNRNEPLESEKLKQLKDDNKNEPQTLGKKQPGVKKGKRKKTKHPKVIGDAATSCSADGKNNSQSKPINAENESGITSGKKESENIGQRSTVMEKEVEDTKSAAESIKKRTEQADHDILNVNSKSPLTPKIDGDISEQSENLSDAIPDAANNAEEVRKFVKATHSFSSKFSYCLVTNCSSNAGVSCRALSRIPWIKVFDFDYESRSTGILAECEELINQSDTTLRITTWNDAAADLEDGEIEWFFPRGYSSSRESLCKGNTKEWAKKTRDNLQQHCESVTRRVYGLAKVVVVVLWYCTESCLGHLKVLLQKLENAVEDVTVLICHDDTLTEDDQSDIQALMRQTDILYDIEVIIDLSLANIFTHLNGMYKSTNATSRSTDEYELPMANLGSDSRKPRERREKNRWLRKYLEVFYVGYPNTPSDGDKTGHEFYRGGTLSWFEIKTAKYDVDRMLTKTIFSQIKRYIEDGQKVRLELFHRPGAGGSTLARRLLWEVNKSGLAVCVEVLSLKSPSEVYERINYLWQVTNLPVVVLLDSGMEYSSVVSLFNKVTGEKAIFLHLRRYVHSIKECDGRRYFLPGEVNSSEARDLANKFSDTLPVEEKYVKRPRLKILAEEVEQGCQKHCLYEFGLTAFGVEYFGLQSYVSGHLRLNESGELTNWQRVLSYLALAKYYGNVSIPAYLFVKMGFLVHGYGETFLENLPQIGQELIIADRFADDRQVKERWKITYQEVAKEILEQVLGTSKPRRKVTSRLSDGSRLNLAKFACKFLRDFSKSNMPEKFVPAPEIMEIIVKIFINRDADTDVYMKSQMSSLIYDISSEPQDSEKLEVLKTLTECFKNDGTAWAQRGRYTQLLNQEDDESVRKYYENAVNLQKRQLESMTGNSAVGQCRRKLANIYHMFGVFLSKIAKKTSKIKEVSEADLENPQSHFHQRVVTVVDLVREAVDKFVQYRQLIVEEDTYGYVGEIEARLCILKFVRYSFQPDGLYGYLKSDAADEESCEYVQECFSTCESLIVECVATVWNLTNDLFRVDAEFTEVTQSAEKALECWNRWTGGTSTIQNRRLKIAILKRKGLVIAQLKMGFKQKSRPGVHMENVSDEDIQEIVDLLQKNMSYISRTADTHQNADLDVLDYIRAVRHKGFPSDLNLEQILEQIEQLSPWFSKSRWAKFYCFILNAMLGIGVGSASNLNGFRIKGKPEYLQRAASLFQEFEDRDLKRLYQKVNHQREWLGKLTLGNGIRRLVADYTLLIGIFRNDYWATQEVQDHLDVRSGEVCYINKKETSGRISIDDGIEREDIKRLQVFFSPMHGQCTKPYLRQRVEFHLAFNQKNFIQAYNVHEMKAVQCQNKKCNTTHLVSKLSVGKKQFMWCKCQQMISLKGYIDCDCLN